MEEKKESLFRKKSVETIESPEVLNEYLHVTSPGIWLLMSSLIIFLIGVFVWGCYGHIDATTNVALIKDGNQVVCYVPESAIQHVIEDPVVTVDGKEMKLKPNVLETITITDETNIYVLIAGNYKAGDIVYPIVVDGTITDDVDSGTVVTESITPISFLLN